MDGQIYSKEAVKRRDALAFLQGKWASSAPVVTLGENIVTLDGARAALTEAERVIRDQEERIRQLESLTLTDELTGLLNRRGFTLALQRELSLARRDPSANGILIMVDLDKFKLVNDLWGHSIGDDYLQTVAHALLSNVRNSDVVARIGGDEFVIMFTRMNEEVGIERMNRLEKIFNSRMMEWDDHTLPLRASFGLSAYTGKDTPKSVFTAADHMLYANKSRRHLKAM